MTLKKFGVIFTFHDSFIESIKYDEFKEELESGTFMELDIKSKAVDVEKV